ncbi:MAG TPA: zinc-dependent metalloprotease, partial [Fodinibius sp.]|nr:zinc-dependent metalloprotease [Fodinibius sp.]
VEATSNAADAAAGEQPDYPLSVYFTQEDSTIHMRGVRVWAVTSDSTRKIQAALDKSSLGPILDSFEIEAVTPDSSAVVFDATGIFVTDREATDPFGPFGGVSSLFSSREPSFNKNRSHLADIQAYEDNITVTSYLSYEVSSSFLGFQTEKERPATYLMRHTLVLLPEETMRPRIADPRIGVSSNEYRKVLGHNGTEQVRYAIRWELKPEDPDALRNGELVEPVRPIVFYIDDTFPDAWVGYVEKGVLDWNRAFEKAGFKNALVVRAYPENNPDFDPRNINYSTINYVLSRNSSARARRWVDPRSGEILSASVSIYQGVLDRLRKSMFIQTGAADKRVRTTDIPDSLLGKAIRDVTARQVGRTLGLARNIGASSAFPVDSLRSPSFTQQYGITPSIMDNVNFNYVAQPGDRERGVKMRPNDIGVYDYYAVKWLYTPIPGADHPEGEVPVLRKWISEKIDDPMYRYRRYQSNSFRDPNTHLSVIGVLGDDRIKASDYAIQNLEYVFRNMNSWVKGEDEDYQFRSELNFSIINIEFYWYWRHVLTNIGGIYQYEKYEGDPFPAFEVVHEEKQKRSLIFLLESFENTSWMDAKGVSQAIPGINGDVQNYKLSILFPYMLRLGTGRLKVSQEKSYEDTYTQSEFLRDIFDFVWEDTAAGDNATRERRMMQTMLVSYLIDQSPVKHAENETDTRSSRAWSGDDRALTQFGIPELTGAASDPVSITGIASGIIHRRLSALKAPGSGEKEHITEVSGTVYSLLKKSETILERAVKEQKGD